MRSRFAFAQSRVVQSGPAVVLFLPGLGPRGGPGADFALQRPRGSRACDGRDLFPPTVRSQLQRPGGDVARSRRHQARHRGGVRRLCDRVRPRLCDAAGGGSRDHRRGADPGGRRHPPQRCRRWRSARRRSSDSMRRRCCWSRARSQSSWSSGTGARGGNRGCPERRRAGAAGRHAGGGSAAGTDIRRAGADSGSALRARDMLVPVTPPFGLRWDKNRRVHATA